MIESEPSTYGTFKNLGDVRTFIGFVINLANRKKIGKTDILSAHFPSPIFNIQYRLTLLLHSINIH